MSDNGFEAGLADAMRRVQDQVESFQQRREALAAIVGEGHGAEGLVTARTRAGGALDELEIDPRAMRLGSEALRDAILEAARAAAANYAEAVAEVSGVPPLDPDALVRDFGGPHGMLGSAMADFKRRTGDIEATLAKVRKDFSL